jgi:hypothetical protein
MTLRLLLYYVVFVATAVTAWPHTYGDRSRVRIMWLIVGAGILALPFIAPAPAGIYYGLALNSTVFFWASDSHMDPYWGTGNRRWRGLVGGVAVCLVPMVWSLPLRSWLAAFLVPTMGHLVITGLATPLVRRALAPPR